MKILRVRGVNLTTFDQFDVDFEGEQLGDVGLYAITGPTGSGKSTLLDAICLALYGRTPRYSNHGGIRIGLPQNDDKHKVLANDPRALMSYGAGFAEAEVDFSRGGRRYRAIWSAQRARKKPSGTLQNAKQELWELLSEHPEHLAEDIVDTQDDRYLALKPLSASKLSVTRKLIEEKVGLRYEEFCRTVFLAQGEFDAFLKRDDDRSTLLELITGDQLYTKIAELAAQHLKTSEERLKLLKTEEESGLLDEVELKRVRTLRSELRDRLSQERAQLSELRQREVSRRELRQLADQLAHLNEEQREAQAYRKASTDQALTEEILHLFRDEELLDIEVLRHQLAAERKQILSELVTLEQQNNHSQEEAQRLRTQREELDLKIEALKERVQARLLILERQKNLQERVFQCDEQLDTIQAEQEEITRQRSDLFRRLAEADELIRSVSGMISSDEAWLISNERDELLVRDKEIWTHTLNHFQSLWNQETKHKLAQRDDEREHTQLRQRLDDCIEAIKERDETCQRLQNEQRELEGRSSQQRAEELIAERSQLGEQLKALHEGTQLVNELNRSFVQLKEFSDKAAHHQQELHTLQELQSEKQIDRRVLEARLQEIERTLLSHDEHQLLKPLRDKLKNGDPCPLCGSLEHPGVPQHMTDIQRDAELRAEHLKGELTGLIAELEQNSLLILSEKQTLGWCQDKLTSFQNQYTMLQKQWNTLRERDAWLSCAIYSPELIEASLIALTFHEGEDGTLWAKQLSGYIQDVKVKIEQKLEERVSEEAILQIELDRLNQITQNRRREDQRRQELVNQRVELEEQLNHIEIVRADLAEQLFELQQELQQALQKLVPYSHPSLKIASQEELTQLRENWLNRSHTWTERSHTYKEHRDRLTRLENEHQVAHGHLKDLERRTEQLSAKRHDIQQQRSLHEGQRNELTPQLDQTGEVEDALTRNLFERDHLDQSDALLQKQREAGSIKRGQMSAKVESIQDRETALKKRSEELMASSQISSEELEIHVDTWRSLDLDPLRESHANWKQAQSKEKELSLLREEAQRRLDEAIETSSVKLKMTTDFSELIREGSSDGLQQLDDQLDLGQQQQSDLNQSIEQGVIEENRVHELINAHERAERLRAQESEEIQFAISEVKRWRLIHDTLGGLGRHSGFNAYAQQFTLELIIQHANYYLDRLLRRYQLMMVKDEKKPLSFQVVDRDLGDEPRSVNSLSGGESFLISLALALGLSSTTSHDTNIESLFIDEGFGTLDPEALDLALTMLDNLQLSGVQIGIISHVEGISERIGTRLHVNRSGAGKSRLSIERNFDTSLEVSS